jgi:tetratricopeptide (TPR) repeat protein
MQSPAEVAPNFRATLDIARENFSAGRYLFGSGPNTFGNIYNLYKPLEINQTIFWATVFNAGASIMATWAGTAGILGVLSLLFLIVAFIWTGVTGTAVRNPSRGIMNVASQSIFVAVIFMFAMWFLYITDITLMAFTFWGVGLFLAASLMFIMESNQSRGVFKEIRIFTSAPKTFIFSLAIVALMVGAIVGVYFEANRYAAEVYFGKAIAASGKGDNEAAINNLAKAADFFKYDERYFQTLAQATFYELNALLAKKDISQEALRAQFQNITTNAIAFAQEAGKLNPQNSFNAVLLGGIYENLTPFIGGASDSALSSYGKAVSLDPKNPANYLAIGRVYIARADLLAQSQGKAEEISAELDKAVSNLEKSVELKQDYAPARFLLVQVYDRQGKLADAIKKAEELVILNNQDTGALFQLGFLYYKAGRYGDSKAVFERTAELAPNYSNARYFLGLIYDREGDKAKALEQFEKIAELNPDNAEVKQIIVNLKAKKAALFNIAPPPQQRTEPPVSEGTAPVKPIKK